MHEPRAVVLCFGPDAAAYRTELYPAYHAEREEAMPDELAPQFAAARDFFEAFGWTVATSDDLEADDLLGTYARREAEAGGQALLLTGDRDMYQCAGDGVTVLYVRTGGKGAEEVGPEEVRERYGIGPELVPDFIALRGDPSDGLPGAKGVGPKTAAELLRKHGSLEAILDSAIREQRPKLRAALIEGREDLLAFKDIATLRDAGVEPPARRADRLGRRRRGGPRARHEPPRRAARGSGVRLARCLSPLAENAPVGTAESAAAPRPAPGGDDRPDALEQDEAPLGVDQGEDGEDRRADQVEGQVEARVGAHALELDRGEGGEDQQGADDLDRPGPCAEPRAPALSPVPGRPRWSAWRCGRDPLARAGRRRPDLPLPPGPMPLRRDGQTAQALALRRRLRRGADALRGPRRGRAAGAVVLGALGPRRPARSRPHDRCVPAAAR